MFSQNTLISNLGLILTFFCMQTLKLGIVLKLLIYKVRVVSHFIYEICTLGWCWRLICGSQFNLLQLFCSNMIILRNLNATKSNLQKQRSLCVRSSSWSFVNEHTNRFQIDENKKLKVMNGQKLLQDWLWDDYWWIHFLHLDQTQIFFL